MILEKFDVYICNAIDCGQKFYVEEDQDPNGCPYCFGGDIQFLNSEPSQLGPYVFVQVIHGSVQEVQEFTEMAEAKEEFKNFTGIDYDAFISSDNMVLRENYDECRIFHIRGPESRNFS